VYVFVVEETNVPVLNPNAKLQSVRMVGQAGQINKYFSKHDDVLVG